MTRIIALLLVVVLLAGSGCSDKNSVPSGILPRAKMESVMWDVIQAEQYSGTYLAKDSARIDLKLENLRLYDQVFRLHQTSREEFRKSYQYYMGQADLAQALFDSLLSKGNRLRTESYNRPASRPVVTTPTPSVPTPAAATPPVSAPAASTSPAKPITHPAMKPGTPFKLSDSVRFRRLLQLRTQKRPDSLTINKKKDS